MMSAPLSPDEEQKVFEGAIAVAVVTFLLGLMIGCLGGRAGTLDRFEDGTYCLCEDD